MSIPKKITVPSETRHGVFKQKKETILSWSSCCHTFGGAAGYGLGWTGDPRPIHMELGKRTEPGAIRSREATRAEKPPQEGGVGGITSQHPLRSTFDTGYG
jgi:hypothetical protein